MRTALALAAGVLAGSVLGQAAPVAWASFQESATSSATLAADVLAPPTGLAASAPYCVPGSHAVNLSWTASASNWLDGYEVRVSTAASGPYAVVPLPAGGDPKATARAVTGLDRKTSYHFVVATTRGSWRAASAAVSISTPARTCA